MTTPKFKKFNIEAYKPGKSKIKKLKKIIKLSYFLFKYSNNIDNTSI